MMISLELWQFRSLQNCKWTDKFGGLEVYTLCVMMISLEVYMLCVMMISLGVWKFGSLHVMCGDDKFGSLEVWKFACCVW